MSPTLIDRIAFRLERYAIQHRLLFKFDGYAMSNLPRFRNRINGHIVTMSELKRIRKATYEA